MVRISLILLLFFISAASGSAQNGSIESGGKTRTFIVYAPSSGLPQHPPLVLSMHGLGGSGSQQRSMSKFDAIADREKFIVVYPDGNYEFMGTCCGWDVSGEADRTFLSALIDTMISRYNVDPKRVYACGFSMGGMVSYWLACAYGSKLAAIGPTAGYNPCSPKTPLSVCHIHGTEDEMVDYSGVAGILNRWITFNGCPKTAVVTDPYPASKPASKAQKEYWGPCNNGQEVALLSVEGMKHAWPGGFGSSDIIASEELWEFFKRHPGATATGTEPVNSRSVKPIVAKWQAGNIHLHGIGQVRSISLLSVQGRALANWHGTGRHEEAAVLPAADLAKGVYVIQVSGGGRQTAIRLIVE